MPQVASVCTYTLLLVVGNWCICLHATANTEATTPNFLGPTIESLSKDVFERHTSTGSEVFSLTICLEAKKFILISFFSLIRTIYPRVSTKTPPNDAKSPLPVDVRRSKTLLLKLPNVGSYCIHLPKLYNEIPSSPFVLFRVLSLSKWPHKGRIIPIINREFLWLNIC